MDFEQLRVTLLVIALFSLFTFHSNTQQNKPQLQLVKNTIEQLPWNDYWKSPILFQSYTKYVVKHLKYMQPVLTITRPWG